MLLILAVRLDDNYLDRSSAGWRRSTQFPFLILYSGGTMYNVCFLNLIAIAVGTINGNPGRLPFWVYYGSGSTTSVAQAWDCDVSVGFINLKLTACNFNVVEVSGALHIKQTVQGLKICKFLICKSLIFQLRYSPCKYLIQNVQNPNNIGCVHLHKAWTVYNSVYKSETWPAHSQYTLGVEVSQLVHCKSQWGYRSLNFCIKRIEHCAMVRSKRLQCAPNNFKGRDIHLGTMYNVQLWKLWLLPWASIHFQCIIVLQIRQFCCQFYFLVFIQSQRAGK